MWGQSVPRIRFAILRREHFKIIGQVTVVTKNIVILNADAFLYKDFVPYIKRLSWIQSAMMVCLKQFGSSWRHFMWISSYLWRTLAKPCSVNAFRYRNLVQVTV